MTEEQHYQEFQRIVDREVEIESIQLLKKHIL